MVAAITKEEAFKNMKTSIGKANKEWINLLELSCEKLPPDESSEILSRMSIEHRRIGKRAAKLASILGGCIARRNKSGKINPVLFTKSKETEPTENEPK